ncbi:MAG: Crp/Fnr family transcriptional regulator [Terriglobales bacterium]
MAKTMSGFSAGFTSKPSNGAPPGNLIRNEILLGLPRKERDLVSPELEAIDLETHELLNEIGEPIRYCYFPNSGMVSILSVMGDGKSVEVGVTGKEGFVGLPLVVGLNTSATRALVQIAGHAFRMRAADLGKLLPKCPQLEKMLNRYTQLLGLQATQVAACNRLHEVNQRLARWLLMSQDRIDGDFVPLTQEFLAHMLGTRRASVTVAAGVLQKAGLIHYTRGAVKIASRSKLEAAACECYEIMTQQYRNWQNELQ